MKAKLILKHRGDYDYFLVVRTENSEAVAASLTPDHEFEQKLSKQNCDEIFGVTGVEKLACDEFPNGNIHGQTSIEQKIRQSAFKVGFNKAMELNRDNVFTEEDMRKAYFDGYNDKEENRYFNPSKSLQKLTEIEVEITMGQLKLNDDCQPYGFPDMTLPKLDENGCLILKTI